MLKRTKAVLTTVGPYQLYGTDLVAACVKSGTDYLDLCGEPVWMRQMIDKYQAAAKASGARIVFSCGYDSIPFELGVFFLQDAAKANFGSTFNRVKGRVRKMKGTFSGGTAASMKAIFAAAANDPSLLPMLRDPFVLTPGFEGPKQPPGNKPQFDDDLDMWVAPFVMANINTRNVHRSNFLLDFSYGQDFVYDEMMVAGPKDTGEAMAKAIVAGNNKMGAQGGPKPGEGPSKEERGGILRSFVPRHRAGWAADARRGDRRPRSRLRLHREDDRRKRHLSGARGGGCAGRHMDAGRGLRSSPGQAVVRSRWHDVWNRTGLKSQRSFRCAREWAIQWPLWLRPNSGEPLRCTADWRQTAPT
jgi:short subunit dehydrogenase-like uncharacterized protein